MKLQKETIQELGSIMEKNYEVNLSPEDLEKFAYSLVGYFSLLLKADTREKNKDEFGNRPASRIDKHFQKRDNTKNKK